MCKQVADSKRGNRWVYFWSTMACSFAVTLAYSAELPSPLDAAERVDKLGAMGVLAFGFLTSLGALAYLIKLQYGRMLTVIDQNTMAVQRVVDAINKCTK